MTTKNDRLRRFIGGPLVITLPEDVEKSAYDESEHPRDEDGRWTSGGATLPTASFDDGYTFLSDADYYKLANAFYHGMKKPTALRSLDLYMGMGHRTLNKHLREDAQAEEYVEDTSTTRMIHDLDALIASNQPLAENSYTYRGIGNAFFGTLSAMDVGDEFEDKGYVSVTVNMDDAMTFTGHAGSKNILNVLLPKGQKYCIGSQAEREMILPRNTRFRVKHKHPSGRITIEVVK